MGDKDTEPSPVLLGSNLFAYCDNNPINKVDHVGFDGVWVELQDGWKYRIDAANSSTRTKRHIHVENKGKKYIQNDDGSPHDKKKGDKGKLPKWLNKLLIQKAGWDYNGKRESFYKKTSIRYQDDGVMKHVFADGSVIYRTSSWMNSYSVNSMEGIYYSSQSVRGGVILPRVFYLPLLGPFGIPMYSFAWQFVVQPIFA